MKKIFLSATIVLIVMNAKAQYVYDYLKAADAYYKKADYASAAEYYEKYLQPGHKGKGSTYNPYSGQLTRKGTTAVGKNGSESHQHAVYNAAESYRMLNNYSKAEPYYAAADSFDVARYPLARYQYGVTLRSLGKYAESEKAFTAFLDVYKTNDVYTESAQRELQNLRFIQTEMQKKDVSLYHIGKEENLNAPGANYAPVWTSDNTLLFTSTRPDTTTKSKAYINSVYQAVYTGEVPSAISKTDLPQAQEMHQGVLAITPGGNTLFLTRWTITKEGKKTAAIYKSNKAGGTWSVPVLLDNTINADGYNTQQPFVTPDGNYLVFSSDKNGGYGGFDLWYTGLTADGSTNGEVHNMGSTINTKGDEQAPFYHAPSKTLVFASNGRVGMGGYDLFQVKGTIDHWGTVQNIGYPVNSVKDDIYFASKGNSKNLLGNALFSSDRSSACCLELFALSKVMPLKQVSGMVTGCEGNTPVAGATVQLVDPSSNAVVSTQTTGADGRYTFTIKDFAPLKAVASSGGYKENALNITVPADEDAVQLTNPAICLTKIEIPPAVGESVVINNLYYELNKAIVLDESKPALDKLAKMMADNPALKIEISGHTDSRGTKAFNQKLSEARAKNVAAYLIASGIDAKRVSYKGYADTMPVAPNITEEGMQQNRRTEFKVLDK